MIRMQWWIGICFIVSAVSGWADERPAPQVRVATFNVSLYREQAGELLQELETAASSQARAIAAIVQTVRPDIVLLNEVDYDASGQVISALRQYYLQRRQGSLAPIDFPYVYSGPVNTGVTSGLDLNRNQRLDDPEDAWGFGRYAGQYGMAVLSRYPLDAAQVRTFQTLLWADMPDALQPRFPDGEAYYDEATWRKLRLSSKSHWDVPIQVGTHTVHLLVCHPTPPVFDGPEDRNGCRNHDEIRFWNDYLSPERAGYLVDDQGRRGGLSESALCVVAGDLNADLEKGNSRREAIQALCQNPRLQDPMPRNPQGTSATAKFGFGDVRVDYCLPSRQTRVIDSGVYWPGKDDPGAEWIRASDHRLVWVTIALP